MTATYDFDPNKMTTREIIDLEETTGKPFQDIFNGMVSGAAIYYLVKKRAGEPVTWDEALDTDLEVLGAFLEPMVQAATPAKRVTKKAPKAS